MSSHREICNEIAESILEHAESISRLDPRGMDQAVYEATHAGHVSAMRLLALPHLDPRLDLELLRRLKSLASGISGVQVQVVDATIEVVIDGAHQQHRVELWNRKRMQGVDGDDFAADWARRYE